MPALPLSSTVMACWPSETEDWRVCVAIVFPARERAGRVRALAIVCTNLKADAMTPFIGKASLIAASFSLGTCVAEGMTPERAGGRSRFSLLLSLRASGLSNRDTYRVQRIGAV